MRQSHFQDSTNLGLTQRGVGELLKQVRDLDAVPKLSGTDAETHPTGQGATRKLRK